MKLKRHVIFTIPYLMLAVFSSGVLAEEADKTVKEFTIKATANASAVGGNLKGTGETITENFRVSSGNIILRESLTVTTLESGRSGSCTLHIIKEVEKDIKAVEGAKPIKMTFPTEVQIKAYASSPGCTVLEPGCLGKTSTRRCQLTGQYTD